MAKETYSVIAGSGTGELSGLQGDGATALGHEKDYGFALSYELAP